jgi:hypothetical protein
VDFRAAQSKVSGCRKIEAAYSRRLALARLIRRQQNVHHIGLVLGNGAPRDQYLCVDCSNLPRRKPRKDGERRGGQPPPTFTMLTTAPGPDVAPQVVIVRPEGWSAWIYLTKPEADLLRSFPGSG